MKKITLLVFFIGMCLFLYFYFIQVPSDSSLIKRLDKHQLIFEKYVSYIEKTTPPGSHILFVVEHAKIACIDGELDCDNEHSVSVDFNRYMDVDLIRTESLMGDGKGVPNEIAFYSYRLGFTKGIAHIVDSKNLRFDTNLDRYGTDDDPRDFSGLTNNSQNPRVYRKLTGQWYLFVQ